MNKYKVELRQSNTYVVDVLAKDEKSARKKAFTKWGKVEEQGMEHYYQIEGTEIETTHLYNVTNTDDSFNP